MGLVLAAAQGQTHDNTLTIGCRTALEGVGLVVGRTDGSFTIALIAHTQQAVIIGKQDVGAVVNLEVDIMAKYVESLLRAQHVH